jgi:hypothetical protein
MAKRKPTDAPPDPAVKRMIDLFHTQFTVRFGFKPDPRHYGRFAKDVKALLSAWGETEVHDLIVLFFTTRDPRIVRSDYTTIAFVALAQHMRVRSGAQADERTVSNMDAAARATGRR